MPKSTIPILPKKVKDIAGKKFGRLTVISFSHVGNEGLAYWKCSCSCGGTSVTKGVSMRSEHVKSCGCWHKEKPLKHGHSRVGMTSPEYRCWCSLRGRCCSKTHEAYSRYGGRGIAICKRWLKSFMAFYRDMGPRPGPEYSLDRINNDGPYSKSNCRWALRVTQGRNRSNNRKLEFQGECLCISEWAERMGCQHQRITARLRRGWSVEKALTTAPLGPGRIK